MNQLFAILIPASLLAVTLALGVGIFALFRGGDFGRSYSNKLMRLRVVLQAAAVVILVTAVWWRHNG
ncbi:twin transmembrane helix small protein [Phenylobacterium sp.]|uniref:twin transmembrane helix small protein n=1 Tax=Phenylobacterium sp. TaxID=1871053 RepID=UPI00272EF102|nr:twin transmembrane helix small protein [Phenylobacterium sp.]MDP1617778.1 twin transmembrane helix small protein [Phenylobacterium sp.]MDP1986795.1 twin transmembrane helix small protein [Phenylobacterium sp.]